MTPGTVSIGYLHPGVVSHCFHEAITATLFHDATHHRRVVSHELGKISVEAGSGGIVSGRNSVVRSFLDAGDAEWLFWIDSDMGFAEDSIDRLVEAADPIDRPVVGGLAFAVKSDGGKPNGGIRYRCVPTVYSFVESGENIGFTPRLDYPRDQLVKVSATGGAIVLIHRSVPERIRQQFGDCWYDPIQHPSGVEFSEDLSFCVRVAAIDIPLYVHTGIQTTHHKGSVYYDEDFYDRQETARLEAVG